MLGQFPQSLKEDRRWVCFDAQKHPIDPATGQNAKPNDPATLGTLEAAQAAASRYGLRGVGVLLGQGLCGIDIDHCRDPSTGSLSEMAAQIIDQMQTYTEASPSGTGVHLLFWGKKPDGPCRKSSIGLEMYDGGRYFTVTGNALNRCHPCAVSGKAGTAPCPCPGSRLENSRPPGRGANPDRLRREGRRAVCRPVCR